MEPQKIHFGGGATETAVHPVILLLVLAVGLVILFRPYKHVISSFLAASILIPMDQVLLVAGLHFPMLRVLALFGIFRIVRDKMSFGTRIFSGGINNIDWSVISLSLATGLSGVLLFQQMGAFVFQLGNIYTTFGLYFLLRFLIRDDKDILRMIRALTYAAAFIALVMAWEIRTGHNPYAILGGAHAASYANLSERDNRYRAMGCFGHPILAGTFGAILVPLFVLLWRKGGKDRMLAAVGIASCTVIVLTSNSSTPILAYAGGVFAILLWPIRRRMRVLRWGIVITLLALHMVMKAPVWHLISRIDVSGGSSGYHRYQLIDQCIRHFSDWWLIGVKSTYDWGWDMWDTANQYVGTADSSGLVPFLLFLATIVYGFKYLGKARKAAKRKNEQMFFWILGACLFANVVSFVGISYWDQTQVVWYTLLAAISAAVASRSEPAKVPSHNQELSDLPADASLEFEGNRIEEEPSFRSLSERFLIN